MPMLDRDGVKPYCQIDGDRLAVLLSYAALWLILACLACPQSGRAGQMAEAVLRSPPFVATLSNNTPLAFGMEVEEVSRALGQPLSLVSGRPGSEIYLAIRNTGGSGLFNHNHRLFLLFRKGRLAGWKGDWGHNWMWQ